MNEVKMQDFADVAQQDEVIELTEEQLAHVIVAGGPAKVAPHAPHSA